MNQPPVVPIKWLSLDDESNMYKRPRSPETFQSSKKKKPGFGKKRISKVTKFSREFKVSPIIAHGILKKIKNSKRIKTIFRKRVIKFKKLPKQMGLSVKKFNELLKKSKSNVTTIAKLRSVIRKQLKLKRNCSFGKKKWIQKVTKTFEKKGTKGAFTKWCKSKGFKGVSMSCISLAKKSKSLKTRRRAIFAQNIR
jgi:hypothetical protein